MAPASAPGGHRDSPVPCGRASPGRIPRGPRSQWQMLMVDLLDDHPIEGLLRSPGSTSTLPRLDALLNSAENKTLVLMTPEEGDALGMGPGDGERKRP